MKYVMIELMNYHTNEEGSNIEIYIKENSINYWVAGDFIFSNLTSVSIKTYSEISLTPNKANFEAIDQSSKRIQPGMVTLFSIISNETLKISDKIYSNLLYTSTEINSVQTSVSAVLIHRTPISFESLIITTDYDNIITSTTLLGHVDVQANYMNFTDLLIQVSGQIIITPSPLKTYWTNIKLDYYKTFRGVWFETFDGDKTELENTIFVGENIEIYYSQTRLSGLNQRHAFVMRGYGDFYLRNSKSSAYSAKNTNMHSYARLSTPDVDIGTDKTFTTLFENIYMNNQDFRTTATLEESPTHGYLFASPFMKMNVTYSNYTIENVFNSGVLGLMQLQLNDMYDVTMKDITLRNIEASRDFIQFLGGNDINIENFKIINLTLHSVNLFTTTGVANIVINSFLFSEITRTGTVTSDFMQISNGANSKIQMNNIEVNDLTLSHARSFMFIESSENSTSTLTDINFHD